MKTALFRSQIAGLFLLSATGVTACSSDEGSGHAVPPSGEITRIQIPVGDFVFDARAAGPEDGEVVLLLHGFPQNSYEWRQQLKALGEAGYRAIAPDQRGYSPGARPADVSEYSILALAGDVVGMADALGVQRFHLVGHDWGAAVAWVVSALAADRVISVEPMSVPHPDAFSVVLADTTSCQYSASAYFDTFTSPGATDLFVANDFALLKAAYAGVPAADVDVYVAELGNRETIDAGLNWYRANVANRQVTNPGLGATTVPTMFFWSDGDTFLCRDGADLTAQYVTGPYRFEVVQGVNHWIPDLASDVVNPLLLEHLRAFPE